MRLFTLSWTDLGIKTKLFILFIVIKIIPLFFISFIAIEAVNQVEQQFTMDMDQMLVKGEKVVTDTADIAIRDSINALDLKSQTSLERLTVEIAHNVSQFLYERDKDILFLSKIEISQKNFENFCNTKSKKITTHEPYSYDEKSGTWKSTPPANKTTSYHTKADLKDNEREFHKLKPVSFAKVIRPIYKEISFYNLQGIEQIKVSAIDQQLKNIKVKANTYLHTENYFETSRNLKKAKSMLVM